MTRITPADLGELRDAIAGTLAIEEPLELVGGGTKRGLGRPLQLPRTLDLSKLTGIRDYQPSELALTAAAATPLSEIEAALAASGQMIAFEPIGALSSVCRLLSRARALSAALSPLICRDPVGSRPGLRAITSSASAASAGAAKSSRRAAKSSKTLQVTIFAS